MIESKHLKQAFKIGNAPQNIQDNLVYSTIMGSMAYNCHNQVGVKTGSPSDMDIYGIFMPSFDEQFPQNQGYIHGFDKPEKYEIGVYQKHHILSLENKCEYDLNIYPFAKYLKLCTENNPNMIDSLFTENNLVLQKSNVSNILRNNKKLFLSKQSKVKLMGYAYGQFQQLEKAEKSNSEKRQKDIENYGYDLKKAYHVIRLTLQVQEILVEHDLHLQRNSEILKDIRAGNWSLSAVREYFKKTEKIIEEAYYVSNLQNAPDINKIKKLMNECFEEYYGSLDKSVLVLPNNYDLLSTDLKELCKKYNL